MATQPSHSALVSPGAGARAIGVSRATLYRRINDGSLPAVRVGPKNTLRIRMSDLQAMLRPADADPADEVASHIAALVAAAPEFSPEQRNTLSALLAEPTLHEGVSA